MLVPENNEPPLKEVPMMLLATVASKAAAVARIMPVPEAPVVVRPVAAK